MNGLLGFHMPTRRAPPITATALYQNRAAYVAEIEALDAEIREIAAGLPADRRTVVTSHDAFPYFGRDYEGAGERSGRGDVKA